MATVLQNEENSRSANTAEAIIQPGKTFEFNQYGNRFQVILATDTVYIKTGATSERPYSKGTGEHFTEGFTFRRLEILNKSANPIVIRIWAGFGEFIDTRADLTENPTEAQGQVAETIAGLASIALPGVASGVRLRRKAIVVSNLDTSTTLSVRDGNGNALCAVFPLTSITLPISGPCFVKNPAGTSVACYIGEIWYTYNV